MPDRIERGRIVAERQPLVAEDLCMGAGTVDQKRDGVLETYTKVGADSLMYDDRTLREAIDAEKSRRFAFLQVDTDTGELCAFHADIDTFAIDPATGELTHTPEGLQDA